MTELTEQAGASAEVRDALSVIQELDEALELLFAGLAATFPSDGGRQETAAMMQHLAPGIERLVKLTYMQAELHVTGERPTPKTIRAYSHNVLSLLDVLADLIASEHEYARRPAVQDDLRFLREDEGLRAMLTVLSHFGGGGRYAIQDGLLDSAKASADAEPSRQWDEVELDLLRTRDDWPDILEEHGGLEAAASFEVASRLQRLARAIARMWTLGALGESGPQHCGALGPILYIKDEELGIRPPKR